MNSRLLSPLANSWALEIGQLCEVFSRVDPREICQVEYGPVYDHKHQPAAPALAQMAAEIARELFAQLTRESPSLLSSECFRKVKATCQQETARALQRSAKLALINGLSFDLQTESAFAEACFSALET